MSVLKVDTINEKTSGNGVNIPGHVIQVVQSVYGSQNSTTSSSWTNTSFTGTITPTKNTSKVLALCQIPFMSYNNSSNESIGLGRLYRDASNYSGYIVVNGYDYGGSGFDCQSYCCSKLARFTSNDKRNNLYISNIASIRD